jgi:WD40 repeat protein
LAISSIRILPKQYYLLSDSRDNTINVVNLSEGKSIKRLTAHYGTITSLISLNYETFASSSKGIIKIWSIKEDIQCM